MIRMLGRLGLILMLLCVGDVVAGAGTSADATAQSVVEGAALYREHCAACHGEKGDGKSRARHGLAPPPRDFTTAEAWQLLTTERMLTSVSYGRADTAMMSFSNRLTETEIKQVVGYVRDSFMRKPEQQQTHSGAAIYKKHCSACHGDKGAGATWTKHSLNPAPRNFTLEQAQLDLSYERMVTSVSHGRPGTAMMSFSARLSEADIHNVVSFIRQRFMGLKDESEDQPGGKVGETIDLSLGLAPHATSSTVEKTRVADMELAFPHGLVGDALAGQQFFQSNCAQCHGRDGKGQGPRASFIKPSPRNFTSVVSRRNLNRPALFRAISQGKRGTVMPAWGQVLDSQRIANVAEYVLQAFILAEKKTLK